MNTNKNPVEAYYDATQDRIKELETLYAEMTRKRGEALERISQLEQERKEIAEKAWEAGADAFDKSITLQGPADFNGRKFQQIKANYLSQSSQTKTENI